MGEKYQSNRSVPDAKRARAHAPIPRGSRRTLEADLAGHVQRANAMAWGGRLCGLPLGRQAPAQPTLDQLNALAEQYAGVARSHPLRAHSIQAMAIRARLAQLDGEDAIATAGAREEAQQALHAYHYQEPPLTAAVSTPEVLAARERLEALRRDQALVAKADADMRWLRTLHTVASRAAVVLGQEPPPFPPDVVHDDDADTDSAGPGVEAPAAVGQASGEAQQPSPTE
jgi:hypothetical protein